MNKKVRVVIVDDNQEFCTIFEQYLNTDKNLEVVGIAHDGIEGMKIIQEVKPDLVILDVVMPKSDGIELLGNLNCLEGKKPKAIMLSALGQEKIIRKAMELGADYYIVKPFSFDMLIKRIEMVFDDNSYLIKPRRTPIEYIVESDIVQVNEDSLEKRISSIMHEIGIPPHLKGYVYLRSAIEKVFNDISLRGKITKELYPSLAKEYTTTSSRVERAIRHAIELAWERGNVTAIEKIFGENNLATRPTNSHFIASISERIKVERSVA